MTWTTRNIVDNRLLRVAYEHRSREQRMGRFGGGWQWKVGVEAGGRTVIVNLLVCYLRIDYRPIRCSRDPRYTVVPIISVRAARAWLERTRPEGGHPSALVRAAAGLLWLTGMILLDLAGMAWDAITGGPDHG